MGRSAQRNPGEIRVCTDRIRESIDRFCHEELDDEYCELCHRMLVFLAEHEPSLTRSRPESWAAGIVHAAGIINLLNDPATSPYLTHREVAAAFGVTENTMRTKSRRIRSRLGIVDHQLPDVTERPEVAQWVVPSLRDDAPVEVFVRYGAAKPASARTSARDGGKGWSGGSWEGPAVIGRIGPCRFQAFAEPRAAASATPPGAHPGSPSNAPPREP